MRVKSKKRAKNKIHNLLDWSLVFVGNWWQKVVVGCALFIVLSSAVFITIVSQAYSVQFGKGVALLDIGFSEIKKYPEALWNTFKGQFSLPVHFQMDIKHLDVQRLEYARQRREQGLRDPDYVPAKIRIDKGDQIKVKVRLKGDRSTHFEDLKTASYRVKVVGDNTIFGMKAFKLQKPRARNYIHEWIFLGMMGHEGVISPRYKFVELYQNGVNLGIYNIEEHYGKELIESNRRRDGPIVRMVEDITADHNEAEILPYKLKKWGKPEFSGQTRKAVQLLEAFRRKELLVSEVFDYKKLATFFAIADLTGAQHALAPRNLRFYYNPIISKLEPIPYDGHVGTTWSQLFIAPDFGLERNVGRTWLAQVYSGWFRIFFSEETTFDEKFVLQYFYELNRVSKRNFIENYFSTVQDELSKNLSIIYRDLPLQDQVFSYGPGPFVFDVNYYYGRGGGIQSLFKGLMVIANLYKKDDRFITLQVKSSDDRFPIRVLGLRCNGSSLPPVVEDSLLVERRSQNEPTTHRVKFSIPEGGQKGWSATSCLELDYQVLGVDETKVEKVLPWPAYDSAYVNSDLMRRASNIENFDFVRWDKKAKIIQLLKGTHEIQKDMIVPGGYQLQAEGGFHLIMNNSSKLVSYSPLKFKGSRENPITISSGDKSGQGIIVLNALGESEFEYVTFSGLKNPSSPDWSVSGMINFYESPVTMENVKFENNNSEDALNIIRGPFKIKNVSFSNIKSDAIDVDFGKGNVVGGYFEKIGNDAIDVSGTEIDIRDIKILEAGDKGISAGEASKVVGSNVEIEGSEIAVASKDNSNVEISGLRIVRSKLGFTAYQKKPEYGPGFINVSSVTYADVVRNSLIESKSVLTFDGIKHIGSAEKVESMLYGNQFGRATR